MDANSKPIPNFNFNLSLNENENNLNFSIEIKKFSEDIIQIDVNEINEVKKYSKKLSLKEFIQLDKTFKVYDSIEEIINFLKKVENKKGISISKNKNDLILTVSLFNIDDSKINIILNQNELTQSELMNFLCDKIKEISFLKKKIKDLENKISEISSKHEKDIENLKNLIENSINQKKEKEPTINEYIKGYSDLTFIENEIKKQLNKQIKSYNLVYKASKDGDKASDFHDKCDNINNNLSIVKTKKGKIFGGFTTQNWKQIGQNNNKYDENAFVFSINNKKIYNIKDKDRAIYCRNDLALFFSGASDIYIYNNCFQKRGGTTQSAYDYKGESYALNGESSFVLDDYEVYEVKFI